MNMQAEQMIAALSKKYEKRTPQELRMISNALTPLFPTLTPKKIRLLTFFLELRMAPTDILPESYAPNSFLLSFYANNNPQLPAIALQRITKHPIALTVGFAAVLDYQKYLGADRLGDTTIENQISFWESSEYFCSMPKTKFYQLIRVAKVIVFSEGHCAYTQGQLLTDKESGSGIYVVRKGQFGCYHSDIKEAEASHFDTGHIFGALELIGQVRVKQRATTVRCKTSEAVVYHFSETIFNQYMRPYCEKVVTNKQAKLLKFLPPQEQLQKSKSLSYSHHIHINKILHSETASSLPFRSSSSQIDQNQQKKELRAFPVLQLEKIQQTATTSFYKNAQRESQRIEEEGLRRSTYLSLKNQGPLKHYPLPAQRSNFLTSEFRDLDRLFAERKQPELQLQPQSLIAPTQIKDIQLAIGRPQRGIWRRDMISSFYRQSIYGSLRRQVE